MTSTASLGWIGLGAMGQPLCGHLLRAGHALTVFDTRPEAMQAVTASGARAAGSIAEVARSCAWIFTSLPDDEALKAVTLGESGLLAHARPGAVFVDTSTVSVEASAAIAAVADARGVEYLRCALSGTSVTAKAAALTLFASGPAELFARAEPLLAHFGPKRFHLGGAEEARAMKLVVNLMVGVSAGMLAEALALGEKMGLEWSSLLDVIESSAVASPFVKYKVPLLRTRDFTPQFTGRLMAKDMGLIVAAAQRAGASTPLADRTLQAFEALRGRDRGEVDMMAVLEVFESGRADD